MKLTNSFNIRMLTLDDLEGWLKQCEILDSESGENNIYYGPYNSDEPYSIDRLRKKHKKLWTQKISIPGWRRAWGIFDSNRIVGSAQITAGELPTNIHRVDLGLGIYKEYRNMGLGKELINIIIEWCKDESSISWIDLGTFSGNKHAKYVFDKLGFETLCYKDDAWCIDGLSIGETFMTLNVK